MRTKHDLHGRTFGRLTVLKKATSGWLCRCSCGTERAWRAFVLVSGNTSSCGCLHREMVSAMFRKHGARTHHESSRTYESWRGAKARTSRVGHKRAKYYIARGIVMCDRWRNDYAAFVADMGECPEGHSLDRIDNNGNYEPGNCRWAPQVQQVRNRNSTIKIVVDGREVPLGEAAEKAGVGYSTARWRQRQGWTAEQILAPTSSSQTTWTSRP